MPAKKDTKRTDAEKVLCDILDPQELEVFAVRALAKRCEIVFTNERARGRFDSDGDMTGDCKMSYTKSLPGLCDHCPYGGRIEVPSPESFLLKDIEDKEYIARSDVVEWFDGKPATVFFLRDVTEENEAKRRLHAFAYTDTLTGIPNRKSLKDDFNELAEKIASNELAGIVALFDLDNFKAINDTYGHNTGDIVLRRLTEHFEEIEAFAGHLYRLGGDEFVLLYTHPSDEFDSEESIKEHYEKLLTLALRAYTLPNIELECTLSIGVSIFPNHGVNLSDVLRKADIALYKAKDAGRNRIVFFESQYDTAQKFKDLYINIQPVLTSAGKTFGYELVDRGADGDTEEKTVNLSEFNRTVDALGLTDIENKSVYFITYSKQLLSPTVLKNLPRDKFIIQVSLTDKLTAEELKDEQRKCAALRKNGYKVALVGLHSNSESKEILNAADFCRFCESDKNTMKQKRIVAEHKRVIFIAPNVNTPDTFKVAQNMGFRLFQGFHFKQPVIGQKVKDISPLKANFYRLLKLASTDGYLDFREISSVIASDVALSYKLLRILNSAAVGLRNVTSIGIAVAYLGEENLKKWIAVLALGGIAEDKPLELVRMSLVRARFGELLAPQFRIKRDAKKVFIVGLLSLLHIALEKTKEQLLEEMPVADDIRESLLTAQGTFSDLLRFYENYEYSNWDAVSQFVEENQLNSQDVNDAYIAAIKWYNALVDTKPKTGL